jgi:hypothetical protein
MSPVHEYIMQRTTNTVGSEQTEALSEKVCDLRFGHLGPRGAAEILKQSGHDSRLAIRESGDGLMGIAIRES